VGRARGTGPSEAGEGEESESPFVGGAGEPMDVRELRDALVELTGEEGGEGDSLETLRRKIK